MAVQIQMRRDTADNWDTADPTLAEGEWGLETDTNKYKIGTGSAAWTSLGYSSLPSGSVTTAGGVTITGTITHGADGTGADVRWNSGTGGDYMLWDASEEKLILEGTNGATVLDITDGNVVIGDGTLTVTGTDGQTALDVPDGNVTVTDSLTVSGGLVAPLQINPQTGTTYTLVLADAGKMITSSNGSAQTITVPPTLSPTDFAVGTQIIIQNIGSANATLAEGSGVTINSKDSNKEIDGQYAAATLIKTATNVWSLIGALA